VKASRKQIMAVAGVATAMGSDLSTGLAGLRSVFVFVFVISI
jgi:hypothetical protein